MTVRQLKDELRARGLSVTGRKRELLERLRSPGAPMSSQATSTEEGTGVKKAFFINSDLDAERRVGLLRLCEQLHLQCTRVVPPSLESSAVKECLANTGLNSFQCSLVHAHKQIILTIKALGERSLVLEDDARLNAAATPEVARQLLQAVQGDFVMGGWCNPSCSHAYMLTPAGATQLLERGFAEPKAPSDCYFPFFGFNVSWPEARAAGGELLFPAHCAGGYEGDLGLLCQDRGMGHSFAYHLAEIMELTQGRGRG
eukprot:TRINITY_DN70917_c0_g1_i1.p2 TRINITY_DN70917_c0_g1~~TRINITY_DN70917_c0_g1_i1.p2  ORF type:complete len:257 (-),score=40.59 TRINITY_DN70917_c0_g1_i1:307-1077(-)